jgi:glycosyltransferase involved in cell wall biosynthesis
MKKFLFSIVIPALNEEKFLPLLLESLAHQTVKNFDVIVVDGKSRDKTVAVAESFRKKIHTLTVVTGSKASLPYQRNLGASMAQGEYLVFIDADTVLLPYCMERMAIFVEKEHPRLFTTWCRPDSEVRQEAIVTLINNFIVEGMVVVKRPLAPGPFTCVTREAFDVVGGYDEAHTFGEDQNFSQRLFTKGIEIQILRETLYIWSLRRLRSKGMLKVSQAYVMDALALLFTKRGLKYMPGYIMGGQEYSKAKKKKASNLTTIKRRVRSALLELFE